MPRPTKVFAHGVADGAAVMPPAHEIFKLQHGFATLSGKYVRRAPGCSVLQAPVSAEPYRSELHTGTR